MLARRIRSASCRWCMPRSRPPDGRSQISMALRSDRGPARSPAFASAAVSRRGSPLAPICRSRRSPRSRRWRRRSFAPAAGAAWWLVSMRGCGRSTLLPMRAHDDEWREWVAPSVDVPAEARRVVALDAGEWFGAGNGFAAYPELAPAARAVARSRRCAADGTIDRGAGAAAAGRRRRGCRRRRGAVLRAPSRCADRRRAGRRRSALTR